MSIEKVREEFAEALRGQLEFKLSAEAIAAAWWAWQASRSSLVVELPSVTYKQNPDEESDIEIRIQSQMRDQLANLGISYK